MKNRFFALILVAIAVASFAPVSGTAQLLFNENFDYVAGSPLLDNGWALTNSTLNPILVTSSGLTYAGYQSSGIGNAAGMVSTGQDVRKDFTEQSTGTLYAGFLVNVSAAQANGDYFLHFIQPPGGSNVFKGRVWIKKDPSSSNFAFGITKSSTTSAQIAYTGYNYALNTTYLVVLKYKFNSGTYNDDVALFIDPVIGAPEPGTPAVSYIDNTQADAASLGFIALRQGSATNAPTLQVDGIRIGQTWDDVTGAIAVVPTLSEWGLILLGMALLGIGSIYILRGKI